MGDEISNFKLSKFQIVNFNSIWIAFNIIIGLAGLLTNLIYIFYLK